MKDLKPSQRAALDIACRVLKIDLVDWLYAVVHLESAWDPLARNPISGARGLIQFMPKTARDLGYASADQLVELHPTAESQLLGPVFRYFQPWARSGFPSLQALAMTVFYPAFRTLPESTPFPAKVQAQNPGIVTIRDYMSKVRRRLP